MFVDSLQEYIPFFLYGAVRALVIFIISLGVVYIFGRQLELVNSNRGKNLISILVAFPLAYWSILIYDLELLVHPWEVYWRTLVYGAGSSILFVLLGWRLFDRVDYLLDKKVAPDKGDPEDGDRKN